MNGYWLPGGTMHRLYIRASKALGRERKWYAKVRAENVKAMPYDGFVYCVSVPSTALVVRRNGRVAISGNCVPMEYEPQRHCKTSIGWQDPRTKDGELAWPERFPESVVKNLKKIGPFAYSGQYQQRPTPRGGAIIQENWWKRWTADEAAKHGVETGKFPFCEYVVASLDTAFTEKETGDYSAFSMWGLFRDAPDQFGEHNRQPRLILMRSWRARLQIHELVQKVTLECRRLNADRLLIEKKANGISVAQEIARLHRGAPFAVDLVDPKRADKVARVYRIQHLFSEGLIYAPETAWADDLIAEVTAFPRAPHDDLVDSMTQALWHFRSIGLVETKAEHKAAHGPKHYRENVPLDTPYDT